MVESWFRARLPTSMLFFFLLYLDLYLFLFSEICLEYGCMGVVKMLRMACPCM